MRAVPDPQMQRVYDMENSAFRAWRSHATSIGKLRQMAAAVCEHYDVPPVTLELRTSRSVLLAEYDFDHDTIALCEREGRQALVLAHELAHHVVDERHGRVADHGPTWARIYADIVGFLGILPTSAMRLVMRENGVRYR